MRNHALNVLIGVAILGSVTAFGGPTFSNVNITSDFGQYSVFSVSTNGDFDSLFFRFVSATVGDDITPPRSGEITIEYDVQAEDGKLLDGLNLRAVGDLQGTGIIEASGLIQDLDMPGIETSDAFSLGNSVQFPYYTEIDLVRSTTRVHVTQSFLLEANDGGGFDIATLSLVVHQLTQIPLPEPSSLGLLALGALTLIKRR